MGLQGRLQHPIQGESLLLHILFALASLLVLVVAFLGAVYQPARLLLAPLCHQQPERSLTLLGQPLAACARCLGFYTGIFLGVLHPLGWVSFRLVLGLILLHLLDAMFGLSSNLTRFALALLATYMVVGWLLQLDSGKNGGAN